MSPAEAAKWILAAACFLPAAYIIVMNWAIFRHNFRSRRSNTDSFSSWIPLAGGVLGSLSIWLLPFAPIKTLWWVPLLIDYGCLIGLTETAIYWSKYNSRHHEPGQKR